ncbi:MAG: M28 family peptidase [Christensenellaceae bacterium]|jgi:hypothetical protein|nr:M28 family peptidase [Christensenellaceae bacterium]
MENKDFSSADTGSKEYPHAKEARSFIKRIIDTHGPRLPGSQEEWDAVTEIKTDFEKATGSDCAREEFTVHPNASIGAIPYCGYAGILATAVYFVNEWAAFAMFIAITTFAIAQIFFYRNWFNFLFPKAKSSNLYSSIDGGDKIDYTIVFSAHPDTSWNWNLALKKPTLMIVKLLFGVAGLFVMDALALARGITGHGISQLYTFGSAWDYIFFIVPIVFFPGFLWISNYLSHDKKIASPGAMDNLSGIAMCLAMANYYRENPEKLPKNCRITIAAMGSEEAGLKGSEAFMKAHAGDKEMLINPYFLNLDSFRDDEHFGCVKGDIWQLTHFTDELLDMAAASMTEIGVKPHFIYNPVGGCDSTPIVRKGYKTITLCAQNPTATTYYHTKNDREEDLSDFSLEKAYELLLNLSDKIHKIEADGKGLYK